MLARAAARVGSARGLCPRQGCSCLKSACRCAGTSPEGGAVAAGVGRGVGAIVATQLGGDAATPATEGSELTSRSTKRKVAEKPGDLAVSMYSSAAP